MSHLLCSAKLAADTSFSDIIFSPGAGAFTLDGNPIIPIGNIDDGGFAISILEPLQHDFSLGGALDGGLTKLAPERLH